MLRWYKQVSGERQSDTLTAFKLLGQVRARTALSLIGFIKIIFRLCLSKAVLKQFDLAINACILYLIQLVLHRQFRKTKTEARSTQISKTKHLNVENESPIENEALENEAPIENEAPKTRNHCRLNNYNFMSGMTQSESGGGSGCVTPPKVDKIHPKVL